MNVAELLPLETIPIHFKGKNLHSGLFLFGKMREQRQILSFNPIALRTAKSFGRSECNRVNSSHCGKGDKYL